jgi:hypothetical protein
MTLDPVHADLIARWKPTDEVIVAGVVAINSTPGTEYAVAPIALANKEVGFWTLDVEVISVTFDDGDVAKAVANTFETVDGVAGLGEVRYDAENAALRALAARETPGTGSYALIRADGTWSVFEGYRTVADYVAKLKAASA